MDTQLLIDAFEQYGYIALFLIFWLGVIGTPIPNEAIVMSGGFISTLGILKTIPTFLVTYLGIIFGFSTGYFIGRLVGSPAIDYLLRKKKYGKYIKKAQELINRYGEISLVVSYMIPVVRIIVPYIVGMNKMPFSKYALYSYTSGLVWTTFYFLIGRYFGYSIDIINVTLTKYSWLIFVIVAIGIILGKSKINRIKSGKLNKVDKENSFRDEKPIAKLENI